MVICLLGVRPDLSPEDKVIRGELAKCLPRAYSELIKSDIPGSLGSRSSRPITLRPLPPSVMKLSHDGPPVIKPTKGELLARVETLSQKSWSVKRKTLDPPEKGRPSWGKVPKLGSFSSSPFAHVRARGQVLSSSSEVPRVPSSQPRSYSTAKDRDSSGRAAEPLLEVMPITVWSPPCVERRASFIEGGRVKGETPRS